MITPALSDMLTQDAGGKGMQGEKETPLPPPPPYSPSTPGLGVAGPSTPINPPTTSTSIFQPQNPQTVNHFLLSAKHRNISGTFLIDPLLPDISGLAKQMRRKPDSVWGKSRGKTDIHASFETRHGPMDLDLAVVAQDRPQAWSKTVPARITVNSKHARTSVNVHEIHHGRSLDLHVEFRHGKLILLLPPTFDGPVVFKTAHTSPHFLPAFAARTRTVRASDRETVVICSTPELSSQPSSPKTFKELAEGGGDRCLIRVKHAKVFVGISGLDQPPEPSGPTTLMKVIGKLFASA